MGLEDKMDARQIVMEAGIFASPEHYSGRGATTSDLNYKILEQTYQIIKREHGKEASEQFVQMVADIPKLSATDFLLTLYRLEGNEWNWDKKILGGEKGIYVDGPTNDAKIISGIMTIGSAFGNRQDRDETAYIRGQFLRKHKIYKEEEKHILFF